MNLRQRAASLAHSPEFLKLWTGQTISLFGSEVTLLALPLTAALTLQATAFQMGLLGAVQYSAYIVIGLVAGVWVDRLRRLPIMIAADLGRALALGTIPVAAVLGLLRMEYLYAAAFVVGILTVFFEVAYQSFLPFLVGREDLVGSNSKLEFSLSLAQITGPGLAGGLVQLITAPLAIAVDALSFIASAASLRLMHSREPSPTVIRTGMVGQIGEGVRILVRDPLLRTMTVCTGVSNLGGNIQYAAYVLYLVRELRLPPAVIGLVFAVGGVGALLGAALAGPLGTRLGRGSAMVIARVAIASGYLVPAFVVASPLAAPLLMLGRLVYGYGVPAYNIHQTSLRQAMTAGHLQGRLNASFRLVARGALPIGLFAGGVLGELIGLRATLLVGAIGPLLALALIVVSPLRAVQEPPPADEMAPA